MARAVFRGRPALWIVLTIIVSTLIGLLSERRWPFQAGNASRRSLVLMLYVILPPIIFVNLVHVEFHGGVGIGLALGLLSIATVGLVAWFIAVRLLNLPRPTAGAVIVCSLLANSSFLGYPMVLTLMGGDDLTEGVVYDVIVNGMSLMLFAFGVGAAFGTRAGEGLRERVKAFFFKNPLLIAAVLGLLAPDVLAPDWLVDASRVLVMLILPLGFFAVGAVLAEEEREGNIRLPPKLHRPVAGIIFTRLVLSPGLLILLSMPFSGIPPSYYLLASMPTGINSMIVGHAYGLDLRTTAEAIVYTTTIVLVAVAGWVLIT